MVKKRQILVIGHNTNGCTPEHEKVAYAVGAEIAKSDSVLITGGLGGVMTAAAHGAKDAGGLTVGIIPQADASEANEYCDIVIPTGMGLTRDFLNALTADGIVNVNKLSVCAVQSNISIPSNPGYNADIFVLPLAGL